jgi:hypothetical protein
MMDALIVFFSCFSVIVGFGIYGILREFGCFQRKELPTFIQPPRVRAGLLHVKPHIINDAKAKFHTIDQLNEKIDVSVKKEKVMDTAKDILIKQISK